MPAEKSHTWIFLRGLGRESGHWGNFVGQFSSAFPEDEILPIDLPGTGEFHNEPAPRSIAATLDFVRAQAVMKARTQSSFKVVAISLGAMVAMEWMSKKSDDLASVVLINTSSKRLSPFYNRLRWQVWAQFARLMTIQSAREREHAIVGLLMNSEEARERALPIWTKIAIDRPISYTNFANQLWAASTFSPLPENCSVPVLVLNGLGDRLVDPSCSTELHRKWSWPIRRHPWAGHDLPWDDPQWTIDKIREWELGTV